MSASITSGANLNKPDLDNVRGVVLALPVSILLSGMLYAVFSTIF